MSAYSFPSGSIMTRPITPSLTVDAIIELRDKHSRPIILIERKFPPYGWALPGGFVDVGEQVELAAAREAREEVSLDIALLRLLGCYSTPDRDPRGHTVSLVYIAEASGEPKAMDDAKNVQAFEINDLPEEMAFDHGQILRDYLKYRKTGETPFPY